MGTSSSELRAEVADLSECLRAESAAVLAAEAEVARLRADLAAANARIADLLRQIDTMAGAIVRNLPPSMPTEPEEKIR